MDVKSGLTFIHIAGYQRRARYRWHGVPPMDAYLSNNQSRDKFFDPAPVFVVASSDGAKARARTTIGMAGLRVADAADIDEVPHRLARQGAASALWIELDADTGAALDTLLDHVAFDVSDGRYPAVIAAPAELLDRIGIHALNGSFEIIVDAEDAERAAALAVAVSGFGRRTSLSDVAADKSAARLRQLSEEVSRIASTLARLSAGPSATPRPIVEGPVTEAPNVSPEIVRSVIRARRLRARYFPENLFADPAWDMMLDLLQAEISHLRVPVSSLCIAAAVPATTALRWLKTLVQEGLFVRRPDPHDGRRIFVELAPQSSQALRRYFTEVGQVPMI
jgi:predicted transcriptional regulator